MKVSAKFSASPRVTPRPHIQGDSSAQRFVIDMSTLDDATVVTKEPQINPSEWRVHRQARFFPPSSKAQVHRRRAKL
jgi:hypothetical protein